MTRAEMGERVGMHADTLGRWLKRATGRLGDAKPGRRLGSGRRLAVEQGQRIKAVLIDKTPDQLSMPYALWTRESVRELIRARWP